jgi:uncharacterized protein YndB with AHSA1/START domain
VVFDALLDCQNYPRWWPAQLRVRALHITPDGVGSRIEIRPWGGWFICEISQVVPYSEIRIEYVQGVHRGTGRWTLEQVADGTRVCYQIDLEPQGWFPRLLSNVLDFGKMHSRSMRQVFEGMESWLKSRRSNP